MRSWTGWTIAAAGVALATPAYAGHYEDGYRAYQGGNYAKALSEWAAGDAEGDIDSTYELSIMYRDGEGVKPDAERAFALTRKAAEAGDSTAQFNLGNYYRKGTGVKVDEVEMRRWYLLSARGFNAKAMHSYATALYEGKGGPKDLAGAVEWYERALIYEDDDGYYLDLIDQGKLPKRDFAARFKARTAAAEAGDAEAQFQLAMMYYNGQGTERDYAKMQRWMLAAATQGHSMAQLRMANIYREGIGREKDRPKAVSWYRTAALNNNAFAQSLLGISLFAGLDGITDRPLGLAMLMMGAHNGDLAALRFRVRMALESTDVEAAKAREIARLCRDKGMDACLPPGVGST